MKNNFYHIPVLVEEAMELMRVRPGGKYVDATLGGGGHTKEMLKAGGIVLGIDQDLGAIDYTAGVFGEAISDKRLFLENENFSQIGEICRKHHWDKLDGCLFDLGVSSRQLTDPDRGFSFKFDGPLDMRMDRRLGVTAADLVNSLPEKQLARLFLEVGGERRAKSIVAEIGRVRRKKKISTTRQLAELMENMASQKSKLHSATKVFMALRIVVNSELYSLELALPIVAELLKIGGRVVVISFHEGEDRVVKRFMKDDSRLLVLTKKAVVSSADEVQKNPRSRSSKMRAGERI